MKVLNDFSWKVAGEAGHGILNAGLMFAKTCLRGGLYVFATAEYPSLIRGGHNHLDVRVTERPLHSHTKKLTLLVALNAESIKRHTRKIEPGGGIVFDGDEIKNAVDLVGDRKDVKLYNVPLLKLANQCGGMIMRNTVAMGATMALADYDLELFNGVLRDNFGAKKGSKVAEDNIIAAKIGYDYIRQNYPGDFGWKLQAVGPRGKLFISGHEALSAGAIAGGCKFFSGYPMTPASSVLHCMAAQEKNYGIVVKHTEDEIAGINMAIGAAYAGARAMTATSGGGFALMAEGLGLSAQTEVPLVIVEAQRPGPATGMATHTGQGDLRFVLHASTDEFPRVIIAPGDAEQCFYLGAEAFNIAERYQVPVILLTDKFVGESYFTVEELRSSDIRIDRGKLLSQEDLERIIKEQGDFRRYKVTKDGISPRAIPGMKGGEHVASSYEHDEYGFEREEEEIRMAMHEKRFRKLDLAAAELPQPQLVGPEDAELTVISWGSPHGPILEAMRALAEQGVKLNYLQVIFLSPFPAKTIAEIIKKSKKTVVVESNKTSQLSGLIKELTGLDADYKVVKYDGRPFNPEDLSAALAEVAKGGAEKVTVLNGWTEALSSKQIEREKWLAAID
jgi:2-oxoglutarate ferredoxin oxidoreductase subunit alpha